MNKSSIIFTFLVVLGFLVVVFIETGGGTSPAQDPSIGYGPNPKLPAPDQSLVPVLNAPTAIGWAEGEKPIAAEGRQVNAFARELDHPRWVYVLPNGDVLVAETNAPKRPDDSKGIKGWISKLFHQVKCLIRRHEKNFEHLVSEFFIQK